MKYSNLFFSLLIAFSAFSCSEQTEEPQEYAPIKLDLKSQEIVDNSNDFGVNLFKEIDRHRHLIPSAAWCHFLCITDPFAEQEKS